MLDNQSHTTVEIELSFFANFEAEDCYPRKYSLLELQRRVLDAHARTKDKLPWVKMATFGSKRSKKNSLRHNANVLQISGVELDYDGEEISFDDALAALQDLRLVALLYTSPSHKPDKPRWRILCPTSTLLLPSSRAKLVARLNGSLKHKLGVGQEQKVAHTESFTLSQAYFFGWAENNPDRDHRAEVVDGDYIDQREDLAEHEAFGAKPKKETPKSQPEDHGHGGFDFFLSRIGDGPGLDGFNNPLIRAAASYVRTRNGQIDIEELKALLRDAIDKAPKDYSKRGRAESIEGYKSDKWLDDQINGAIEKYALPMLRIAAGHEEDNSIDAQKILIDNGIEIFQYASQLMRPVVEEADAADGRKTTVVRMRKLLPEFLNLELCKLIWYEKFDARKNKYVRVRPDSRTTCDIMVQEGRWLFSRVTGVITTPTLRPDGTILSKPGYDEKTGLLLLSPPAMPPIPDHPTPKDAAKALDVLKSLLTEFPFVVEEKEDDKSVSQSVALSAIITPVVRGALPVAPAHCINAAVSGSGKSYFLDLVAAVGTGRLMPVMSATVGDELETEKRLTAALVCGQQLVSLDNVDGELSGSFLCEAIERPRLSIRPFGKNTENIEIDNRSTSIFMNGNNLTLVGDVVRRVVTATIDPRLEQPELRKFKGSPVQAVLNDRGKYVAACLTICRAYVVAGRPDKADPPLGSFEAWSDTVRSALVWLYEADPAKSIQAARREDPARARLYDMLTAWAGMIGTGYDSRVTLAAAVRAATAGVARSGTSPFGALDKYALRDAMLAVTPKQTDTSVDVNVVGKWLRSNKGKIADGFRFMNEAATGHNAAQWYVEQI
jgi:hypothetical protein